MTTPQTERQRQVEEKEQIRADLRAVMSTPTGRRCFAVILETTGVDTASFAGEATHESAFREGRRSIGLIIRSTLQQETPESYAAMVQEQLATREFARARPPEPEEDE